MWSGFGFIIWTSIIQQLPAIGNLRYLGVSSKQIETFYIKQSSKLASIITLFGIIFGIVISQIVYNMVATISNFNQTTIDIEFYDIAFVTCFSLSIIILITLCIIKLLNKPIQMSHFNSEQPAKINSTSLIIITGILSIFLIIFLILNELAIQPIIIIVGILSAIFLLLFVIDINVFVHFKRLYNTKLPIQIRIAMKCLSESHTVRRLTFISISLALITILSIAHYEQSLIKEFNPESKNAAIPSLFMIDLYSKSSTIISINN